MEQGGENHISIGSKSVNENSVSATSLRPTLKASDLRSTMASLNSNDTPLTQTGIPQAEHEGDSDTTDKQPEASPALNEAKEAAADLHVTLPPVDSSEMEVNDDSLNRDSGVTGTSGAADSSHAKSVPEAAGHHGASDSNHVPARPRMRASVLGASKVSLNKVGGEAIVAEANGSTKPETDKAEASGNRSASDSNTAISRPKMRASELGVSKSSLNKVKGDYSPSVGVESTDVQPEAAAPEAAGHCPDSGATRPKMRMRSSELGVSKASLNKVKGDSSPFVDAELSDVQPETVEKGEAAHHNANDSTPGPPRPRMRASELGAKKSSLQSVGAEGERKPGTGNADNVLPQVVSPALRMLVEQPEVHINREPVADDRPRAVVFGHAQSAAQQQPRMRASELGTKRASLKKVDRHSKDPEDWESSKRKSRTESQSRDEPSIIPPALRLFDEPDPLSNMILVAEGTELHVHKEVLGSWSPVFMAMFSSSFVETQQNRVDMYGKTVEDIRLLLNCIYPPNILSVNSENVMTLLPLVEEYGITALKEKCEDIIAAYEPSLDVVLIAHQFNMPQLMERTIEACACLPLNAIDHKKNSELTDHIPETVLLGIYRTKIENQIEQIRQFKKLRERVTTTKQRLRKFGKAANSYPCEKHREFKEECVLCLQKFRETTYAEIDKLFDI